MRTHSGAFNGADLRIAIVAARFNDAIVSNLVSGAREELIRRGCADDDIHVAWVPGAFEIPLAAHRLAQSGRYDALITLGSVIRGATPHFEYVSAQVSSGCASVGLDLAIPVIFGVLTTDTIDQALERAGTKAGNKGADGAAAAVETVNALRSITR